MTAPTPRAAAIAALRTATPGEWIDPWVLAPRVLNAAASAARAELGPDDCGCGGCDSCVQHRLLDRLVE